MVLHVGMSLRVCIAAVPAAVTFPYHGDSQGVAGWAPPFGQPPSRQDLVPPSRDQWALRTADEARRAAELYLGALLGVVHLAFVVNETGNSHHPMRRRRRQASAMIQDLDEFGCGEFMVGTEARLDGLARRIHRCGFSPRPR